MDERLVKQLIKDLQKMLKSNRTQKASDTIINAPGTFIFGLNLGLCISFLLGILLFVFILKLI